MLIVPALATLQLELTCRHPLWWQQLLILYLAFAIFLFGFGVVKNWDQAVGSHEAGTWLARLDGGLRIFLFGQIFAAIPFPFGAGVHYLLWRFLLAPLPNTGNF